MILFFLTISPDSPPSLWSATLSGGGHVKFCTIAGFVNPPELLLVKKKEKKKLKVDDEYRERGKVRESLLAKE